MFPISIEGWLALIVLLAIGAYVARVLKLSMPIFPLAMAVLTEDRLTSVKHLGLASYPVAASTKIFAGSIVAINSSGYAVPGADTAGLKVVGTANEQADNSSGSNGDLNITVQAPIRALFAATSITQAMVGQPMYVVDDQTFDDQPGTNGILAGVLDEYVSSTEGWIVVNSIVKAALTDVTADAAEINKLDGLLTTEAELAALDGIVTDATIVVGAEDTNVRPITIQLKDANGADIAHRAAVQIAVLLDANGDAFVATGGSTGIEIGTDGALLAVVAKKLFVAISEADGDIDLTWTDTGTEAAYLAVILPNGKMIISTALTNA